MDYPIVFIPGLFGSFGDDVIPGTGEFSFGLAEEIYRPFINILESMGYTEGEDLFICYYDWKKSVIEAVDKYLFPLVEKIKRQRKTDKIIIIGHSLGGLLGRAYEMYFNPAIVDKLILIGTPNLGAANAYSFWSGGKLPYSKLEDNILYNGVKLGFVLYYRLYHDKSYIDGLRKIFPVVEDLLPSYGYGNYLFWEKDGIRRGIPIEDMLVSNPFLNRLNSEIKVGSYLYIIAGKGSYTNKEFLVELEDKEKTKWSDGRPIKTYKTNYGDGTVTTSSSLGNLRGNNIILQGNHIDILYKSKDYLSQILDRPIVEDVKLSKVEKVEVLLARDCHEIEIITSDNSRVSSKSMEIRDSRVKVIDLGGNNYWVMTVGDKDMEVKMDVDKGKRGKVYRDVVEII